MKKYLILIVSIVAIFGLSGCHSDGRYYERGYDDTSSNMTTLFLVDEQGSSYAGIPYKCDSMIHWETTAPNGEFSFYEPESCEFNFLSLEGNLFNDPRVDNIVRIVDYTETGKGGIPYECASFGASTTLGDGSFEYDIDDMCSFYL